MQKSGEKSEGERKDRGGTKRLHRQRKAEKEGKGRGGRERRNKRGKAEEEGKGRRGREWKKLNRKERKKTSRGRKGRIVWYDRKGGKGRRQKKK